MKRIGSIFVLILFVIANNPIYSHAYQQPRRENALSQIMIGMKQNQAIEILGQPYKKERRLSDGVEYDVLYFPNGNSVYQTRYADKNFIPLIFYKEDLQGWGWSFFKRIFDVREGRFKAKNVRYYKSRRELESVQETQILNNNNQVKINKTDENQNNKRVEQALQSFIQETVAPQAPAQSNPVQQQTTVVAPQAQAPVAPIQQQTTVVTPAPVQAQEVKTVVAPQVQAPAAPIQQQTTVVAPAPVQAQEVKTVVAPQVQAPAAQVQQQTTAIMPAQPQVQEVKAAAPQAPVQLEAVKQQSMPQPTAIKNIVQPQVELKAIKPQESKREIPVIEILIHSNNASVQSSNNTQNKDAQKIEVRVLNPSNAVNTQVTPNTIKSDTKENKDSLENTSACIFKITKHDELTQINEPQFEIKITLVN